jgi:hypothetical protein
MSIEAFVRSLETSFSSFDLDRVMLHYAVPCTIVHEQETVQIATEAALRARASDSLEEMYRVGIRRFELTALSAVACGARLTLLRYESTRHYADGRRDDPGHETAILRELDGQQRIVVSINPRSYWRDTARTWQV